MKNSLPQGMIQKVVFALLFITGAILYAQDKTYASSQSYQTNGILCPGCSVENPQNAVGSDETNFATIKIPLSLLGGKVEQTLIFPEKTKKHFKKIVIGIGSPSHVLSAKLLGGEAYVESYSGGTSNGDKTLINNNMLELGQGQKRGTIAFTPAKFFDAIKITLNGGTLGLNDALQIYYAYHTPDQFTNCGNPPLDPLYYYPFNGNTNDVISGMNLIPDNATTATFQTGQTCSNTLISHKTSSLDNYQAVIPNHSMLKGSKTVSFFARVNESSSSIGIEIPRLQILLAPYVFSAQSYTQAPHIESDNITPNQMDFYTVVFQEEGDIAKLCLYKNGDYIVSQGSGCLECDLEPGEGICEKFGEHTVNTNLIKVDLKNAQIDELLVYDKALNYYEVLELACSYGKSQNCTDPNVTSKKINSTETFTISPNPTTGEITLDGNVLLVGSDISIRNTSGTEVYHSAFRSRTFELPATLPGGVYMLTLQTKDKKIYTRKIILTR
ncbi:T9SS type A sorting domain-containing protein [Chryseobacterium sp. NRRL B-14859]|uniref:T9SS type A sorting domain-containing protein n=1 Tax=unclassified Chryseobacterium TaxID=2593645 RepID=UPI000F44ED63|nr:T9SS type A sorting domain-containing protein [Chryseobacterium sp. G0240]ROI02127.1 T9SS C-terminal target domain-containing protein [Chryseobacterium sp. G0240]